MAEKQTPLLDRIARPTDLRQLDKGDLRQLANWRKSPLSS